MDGFMKKIMPSFKDDQRNCSPGRHSRNPTEIKIVGNLRKCDREGKLRNRNFVGLVTQTSSLTRLDPDHTRTDYDSRHSDPGHRDMNYEQSDPVRGRGSMDYATKFDYNPGYMKPNDSNTTLEFEPKKHENGENNRSTFMANLKMRTKKPGIPCYCTPCNNGSPDWICEPMDPDAVYELGARNANLKAQRVPAGEVNAPLFTMPYPSNNNCANVNRRDCWGSNYDVLEQCRISNNPRKLRSYELRNSMSKHSDGLEHDRERGGSRERDHSRDHRRSYDRDHSHDRSHDQDRSREFKEEQSKFSSKFKDPSLPVVKEYLQKCLMQRLTVDWTEEDDLQLANSIYMHLSNMRDSNFVCAVLEEISKEKKLEPMFKSYVDKLRRIYRISGLCGGLQEQNRIEITATAVPTRRPATSGMMSSESQRHMSKLTGNDNRPAPVKRVEEQRKTSGNEYYNFNKEGTQKPHGTNAGRETHRSEEKIEPKLDSFVTDYKERDARMYSLEHDVKEGRTEKYINSMTYEAPEGRKRFDTRHHGPAENNSECNSYITAGSPSETYGYMPPENYSGTYRYDSARKYPSGYHTAAKPHETHNYGSVGKYSEAHSYGTPGKYSDANNYDAAGGSTETYGCNLSQKYPETYTFSSVVKYPEDRSYVAAGRHTENRPYIQAERYPQPYSYVAGGGQCDSYPSTEKYSLSEHYTQYKDEEGQRDKTGTNEIFGVVNYGASPKQTKQLPRRPYICDSCGIENCQCAKLSNHRPSVCQKCFTHPCRCNKPRNESFIHPNISKDENNDSNHDAFARNSKKGVENHGHMQQDPQELQDSDDKSPVSVRCVLERDGNVENSKNEIVIHGRLSHNTAQIDGYDFNYETSTK